MKGNRKSSFSIRTQSLISISNMNNPLQMKLQLDTNRGNYSHVYVNSKSRQKEKK